MSTDLNPGALTHFKVQNFRRVDLIEADVVPGLNLVVGPHRSGKSSLLTGIVYTLFGGTIPPDAIRDGQSEAVVELECEHAIVMARLTKNKAGEVSASQVKIRAKEDNVAFQRRELSQTLAPYAGDPTAFLYLPKQERYAWVARIAGFDTAAWDRQMKGLEELRKDAKKEAKRVETTLQAASRYPEVTETKEIVTADLLAQLNTIQQELQERDRREQAVTALEAEIAELEAKLATKKQDLAKLQALPDITASDEELQALQTQIAGADERNTKIRANATHRQLEQAATTAQEAADDAEAKVAAHRQLRIDTLAEAGSLPNGISLGDDEEVLLNGRILEAASQEEILTAGLQLIMAENPALRVIITTNQVPMLPDAQRHIAALAKEHGFPYLCEVPAMPGTAFDPDVNVIEIVDGRGSKIIETREPVAVASDLDEG